MSSRYSALKSAVSFPPIVDETKAQATVTQGQPEAQKRLRRRRTRVICIKLLADILFLFAWSFVTLNDSTYKWITLLGGRYWIDFAVNAGVAASLPLFSFIGLLREGILVSQVWFEAVWLLGVSAFDTFLIYRLIKHPPPFEDWTSSVFDDPYLTVSVALYVLTVTGLAFDLLFSLLWSSYLSTIAWLNSGRYPKIWLAHAADFPWVSNNPPPRQSVSSLQLIIGAPRRPPVHKSIPISVKNWIMGSTMFRRFGPFEPLSHSITRGCVALIFWVVLLAYGIFNCVMNPIRQFTSSKGLPTRSLTKDSRPNGTFGHISGFIALDVVPYSQYATADGGWKYPPGMCDGIFGGLDASFTDPATNQSTTCDVQCGGLKFWNQYHTFLQVEARWDCGSIWDNLTYQTSIAAPNTRPYVTVIWNSAYYPAKPVLNAGILSVPISRNQSDYNSVIKWGTDSPREWKHGVTFNLTAGQTLGVDLGRRRIHANRATLPDLIGVSQSPDIFVTYPIRDLVSTDSVDSSSSKLTIINFYPAFGAYDDEIYEEYLDCTVLSGLSATGGLYSFFEFIFTLIYGRSLVTALFGGKHVTPFGKIASVLERESFQQNLLNEYPGIDGNDPAQRAHATCKFLHDFVLDLNPVEIPYTDTVQESGKDDQEYSDSDDNDSKVDIKAAEKMPSLPY